MRQTVVLVLAGLLSIGLIANSTEFGNPISVNDVTLQAWEFDRELRQLIPFSSFHGRVEGDRLHQLEQQARKTLILKELKHQWAGQQELPIDTPAVDRKATKIRNRFDDRESFEAALAARGITESDFRHAIMRDVAADAVDSHIRQSISPPTEVEMRAFFNLNREDYVTPESRHVTHVLIPVSPSAEPAAWEQAETEAAILAAAARENRIDLAGEAARRREKLSPSIRDQTGDLASIHQGAFVPAVDRPVFSANPGDVVGPIRSIQGFSVVKVLSVHPPSQLEFDQIRDAVADRITRERRTVALKSFEDQLLASAIIEEGR